MNNSDKKPVRDKVLDAIKSGRVHMRSRTHFLIQATLLGLGSLIVLLFVLYFASFAIAVLRRSGAMFAPGLGPQGWWAFFAAMPWALILLSLVFLTLLQVLIRRYGFVYRHPLIYSGIGIVLLSIAGAIVIAETPLHPRLFRFAEEGRLPYAGRFYARFDRMHMPHLQVGTVNETTTYGFLLQNGRGEVLAVFVGPTTTLPTGGEFSPGDSVVVFGDFSSGTIRAVGVREVRGEYLPMHRFRGAPPF